jgi:hypothetical protein
VVESEVTIVSSSYTIMSLSSSEVGLTIAAVFFILFGIGYVIARRRAQQDEQRRLRRDVIELSNP